MIEAERISLRHECPSEFSEPFSGTLHDRYYSAMPANPYINEQIKERQALIKDEFAKLFEHPPVELAIPEQFQQLLVDDYYINVERRRMINYENFAQWRQDTPSAGAPLEPIIQRVEAGYAETGDVFDVALSTDLPGGLEVGRVTHPYWQRIEHVSTMRLDAAAEIVERGGSIEPLEAPYRRIKITPHVERLGNNGEQEITGFIVRYKHDFGFIPKKDGEVLRVVERQVAAYRTDEASGFPADILEAMQEAALAATKANPKQPFYWDTPSDERFEALISDTRCRGFIERIVQTDTVEPFVVPESTTLFCYTEKVPLNSPVTPRTLAKVALRSPDSDNGIAFFNSNTR